MTAESKTSIISSISTWLKLVALIVLVGEAFLITAMTITDKEDSMRSWYPILMVSLLFVIVVGLFIDRRHNRDSETEQLKIKVDNMEVQMNTKRTTAPDKPDNSSTLFHNSIAGFTFDFKDRAGWHPSKQFSYKEYLLYMGLIQEEHWPELVQNMELVPVHRMMIRSTITYLHHGKSIQMVLTDASTTPVAERLIISVVNMKKKEGVTLSESEIQEMRYELARSNGSFDQMKYENSFAIQVMDKADCGEGNESINLPQVFVTLQLVLKEVIEEMSASRDMILWVSTSRTNNILLDGVNSDISIYRMNALMEKNNKFYQLQVQWSPQSTSAITVWTQLKSMIESFQLY